uniref:Uncharacterized protein n=1 Tax=Rhizophora mucronata TaxID=61149 RepID=A0A2P2NRU8_RHIMU
MTSLLVAPLYFKNVKYAGLNFKESIQSLKNGLYFPFLSESLKLFLSNCSRIHFL